MMLLFVSTFAGHIVGYIHLAKELQMNLLLRLSQTALVALCAFGLLVIPWIIIDSSTGASRIIFPTFAIALLIVVLSLGTGIATLYGRFGFLAILSVPVGLAIPFIWNVWPAVVLLLPSVILLFLAARR